MEQFRIALLDMNNGVPNQGMQGIRNLVNDFKTEQLSHLDLQISEYEVRKKHELPDLNHDIYIFSGGPGDPRRNTNTWENHWYQLVDGIRDHNRTPAKKKFAFFVCHSFQMVCRHLGLCKITRRKSTSFGIYPIHKTAAGKTDQLLEGLNDPYYGVDSRDWQLVEPQRAVFKQLGANILSLEKIRTHVEYERAIMAVRFTPEMVGTQFHPEAEPRGMRIHFDKKKNREKVIENFSVRKYHKMMAALESPEAISRTYRKVIPGFLARAIENLTLQTKEEHAA
jgi:GMP synthase-like glutamine amidotransferase